MEVTVLSQQTLVLNKAWSAISMTSVREALSLLFDRLPRGPKRRTVRRMSR